MPFTPKTILAVLLAAIWLQIASSTSPFSRNSTKAEIKDYLKKYGHYFENNGAQQLEDPLVTALKSIQKYGKIPVTGEVDNATIDLMNTPRCQLPDYRSPQNRQKRYVAEGKWNINSLTYRIINSPTNTISLTSTNLLPVLQVSFNDWASVASLVFKEAPANSYSDINLAFYSYDHGDGYPFDGPGKTLAHAFFPEDGRLHFDDSETWSYGTSLGRNIRQTATHELGHILGLDHSPIKTAVMYAYYPGYLPAFKLDPDDIAGIQSLYGPPGLITVNTPTTTTLPIIITTSTIIPTTPSTTTTTTTIKTSPPTTTTITVKTSPTTTTTTTFTTTITTTATVLKTTATTSFFLNSPSTPIYSVSTASLPSYTTFNSFTIFTPLQYTNTPMLYTTNAPFQYTTGFPPFFTTWPGVGQTQLTSFYFFYTSFATPTNYVAGNTNWLTNLVRATT